MSEFYVEVDDQVTFSKTVGESDIYGFAGITGDFSPNHVNDQYMKSSSYGQRIAHGALMVGYMSTTSTMMKRPTTPTIMKNPRKKNTQRVVLYYYLIN